MLYLVEFHIQWLWIDIVYIVSNSDFQNYIYNSNVMKDFFFFLVNSNTYYNTYKNSNISILIWVYNTLFNQSTTTKGFNHFSTSKCLGWTNVLYV